MTNRHRNWDPRIALVAALVFVLQSVAGAFAGGASTASLQRDAFGNPICITSGDYGVPGQGNGDHAGNGQCCVLGCASGAGVLDVPPAGFALPHRGASSINAASPLVTGIGAWDQEYRPGNPRAPPLAA